MATVVLLLVLLVGAPVPVEFAWNASGEPESTDFLNVRIDTVSPDIVTTTADPVVTVTGTIVNIGDRPVRDVVVRLEHAPSITSSAQLRSDLASAPAQFEPVAEFVSLSPELPSGESVGFTLAYPLRSGAKAALGINHPGVYPLLVNVNGTPDYGEPARLDDARFLLPVLGLPAADIGEAAELTGIVTPDTTKPVAVTMLWPLADKPRLTPGTPGGTTPIPLIDDDLATSLATGGRLDGLLGAAEFATSPAVDPDGEMARTLCLAVDPDLLVTVNAMTSGYIVSEVPGTAGRPGSGQAAAGAWLARLRALAGRMCVVAVPYAQADLDALERVGDPELARFTTTGAGDLVQQLLGVNPVRGVTLIGDGPLNDRVLELLNTQGPTVAVAAADGATDEAGGPSTAEVAPQRMSSQVVTAPFDPAVAAALAGAGTDPASPSYLDSSLVTPLDPAATVARRQDAVSAMLWRGLATDTEPRSQILMPPLTWSLAPEDGAALLSALATLINTGLATPRPLIDVLSALGDPQPPQPPSAAANQDTRARIADDLVTEIRAELQRLQGLTAALTTDQQTGLTGAQYTAPLREDMLRALSQSQPAEARNSLAGDRLAVVGRTIADLFRAVSIVNPGGSYTLATERSPLPLALRNDLAVPIKVRLRVDAPPGMVVTDIGELELPPGYLPLRVPIEVHFTQRVAVDVWLQTPDGLQLGEPVRLSVHSNAYGKVLFLVTMGAAAVLVLLTGRRLWHRFRGQPDPADLEPPSRRQP